MSRIKNVGLTIFLALVLCTDYIKSQHLDLGPVSGEDGTAIRIQESSGVGLRILKTGSSAIDIDSATFTGLRVQHALRGVLISRAERNAFESVVSGENGVRVFRAGINGFLIEEAGQDGVHVEEAERNGVFVEDVNANGLEVENAGNDGVFVNQADDDGVNILNAGDDGVNVFIAGGDGFQVAQSGGHGLVVGNAGGSGIRVSNADLYSIDIQGDKRGVASVENHIARLQNFNSTSGADVLALKVNELADPGDNTNFITFFKGGPDNTIDNALGAIEGNGSGGITFKTSGADFAESLSQINQDEVIRSGDVVGVYKGKISLKTKGADQVMVITDRPAIIGNHGPEKEALITSNVSFIGQVPVRVQGPVKSGDWLVQSGLENGIAKATTINQLQPGDHIIGQAWEDINESRIEKVNVLTGIGHQQFFQTRIDQMENELQIQKAEIENLKNQLKSIIEKIRK